jgi:hypothetical protein
MSIKDNSQVGLSCAGAITGTGVYVSGNSGGVDINTTCAVSPCTSTSSTCGAQSQPH